MCAHSSRSLLYLFVLHREATVANVVTDGSCEQERLLLHNTDLAAQRALGHVAHVVSIDQHCAFLHIIEAREQPCDSAFTGPGWPNYSHRLPSLNVQAEVVQHRQVAHVLNDLGTEKAWIVHGSDGLDEMTTTGVTRVAMLDQGQVTVHDIAPEDAGLKRASLAQLRGGSADENARAIRELFDGAKTPFRDIVLLNAGAALVVAGKAKTLSQGVALAAKAIDEGGAAAALGLARNR